MDRPLKRISLMVREDQYEEIQRRGLNLSGLARDLLDDYLSDHKITVSVTEETRSLYDRIVSNTGTTDLEVERYFRDALKLMLNDRIAEMQKLQKEVFGRGKKDGPRA